MSFMNSIFVHQERSSDHQRCYTKSYNQVKQRHNTLTCITVVASAVGSRAFQEDINVRLYEALVCSLYNCQR